MNMQLLVGEIEEVIRHWKGGRILPGEALATIEKLVKTYNVFGPDSILPERCVFKLLNERGQWVDFLDVNCDTCYFKDNCKLYTKGGA